MLACSNSSNDNDSVTCNADNEMMHAETKFNYISNKIEGCNLMLTWNEFHEDNINLNFEWEYDVFKDYAKKR